MILSLTSKQLLAWICYGERGLGLGPRLRRQLARLGRAGLGMLAGRLCVARKLGWWAVGGEQAGLLCGLTGRQLTSWCADKWLQL